MGYISISKSFKWVLYDREKRNAFFFLLLTSVEVNFKNIHDVGIELFVVLR